MLTLSLQIAATEFGETIRAPVAWRVLGAQAMGFLFRASEQAR
jgi:hypothetical protein